MMRKAILVATLLVSLLCGCKSKNIWFIDESLNDNEMHQSTGAFNDKQYIWSNWFITNDSKVK